MLRAYGRGRSLSSRGARMTANAIVARLQEAGQLPAEQWQAALSLAVDAEQSLIGSLLYNPDTYDAVASIIRPHHFHEPVHRHIFRCVRRVSHRGPARKPTGSPTGARA